MLKINSVKSLLLKAQCILAPVNVALEPSSLGLNPATSLIKCDLGQVLLSQFPYLQNTNNNSTYHVNRLF